jgi:hypothetical protein
LKASASRILTPSSAWTILIVLCLSAGVGCGRESEPHSTMGGVFTKAQADLGADVFGAICVSCHTPAAHTGLAFATNWGGHPLSELYQFVSQKMPKSEPGSLSPDEYAQVVAYLLSLNGMPAGQHELSTDTIALKKIQIDLPPKKGL